MQNLRAQSSVSRASGPLAHSNHEEFFCSSALPPPARFHKDELFYWGSQQYSASTNWSIQAWASALCLHRTCARALHCPKLLHPSWETRWRRSGHWQIISHAICHHLQLKIMPCPPVACSLYRQGLPPQSLLRPPRKALAVQTQQSEPPSVVLSNLAPPLGSSKIIRNLIPIVIFQSRRLEEDSKTSLDGGLLGALIATLGHNLHLAKANANSMFLPFGLDESFHLASTKHFHHS